MMIQGQEAFGPTLKAERDRRGITLQAIADSTKISTSLLAALERNDMSRWPKGIFRRAFVREYAAAVGLPPESVVAEFTRLFPDSTCTEPLETTEFRLTLERDPSPTWAQLRTRALVAAIECSAVLALGAVTAWWLATPLWATSGVIGLFYYPLANICLERGPKPRLIFSPVGITRRLGHSRAIGLLHSLWSRPALAIARPVPEESAGAASATPELRTASN